MSKVEELISGIRSINHGPRHEVRISGDDEPVCYQRKEWVEWILELADEAEQEISNQPTAKQEV